MPCIFCEIVAGRAPSTKIYEVRASCLVLPVCRWIQTCVPLCQLPIHAQDELTCAFLDINPIAHWHTLVIPKRHFERIEDADDESAAALGVALKRVGRVMNELTLGPDYNVLLANGRNAGQEARILWADGRMELIEASLTSIFIFPHFPKGGPRALPSHPTDGARRWAGVQVEGGTLASAAAD